MREGEPVTEKRFTVEIAVDDLNPFLSTYETTAARIYRESSIMPDMISRNEDLVVIELIQDFFDLLGQRPLLDAIEDRLCDQYVTPNEQDRILEETT